MDFNLSNLGSRKFVSLKSVKKPWNDGQNVLEVSESHFTFSNDLCGRLGINDNNVITLFDKGEEGLYLANITNQIKEIAHPKHVCHDGSTIFTVDTLLPSLQKPNLVVNNVNYYKSRRASRKQLLNVFREKMGGELGMYNAGELVDAPFPCVRLSLVTDQVENVEVVEIVEVTDEVVNVIENLVADVELNNASNDFIASNVVQADQVKNTGGAW